MKVKIISSVIIGLCCFLVTAYGQSPKSGQTRKKQEWESEKKLMLHLGDYLLSPTRSNNFYGVIQYNHFHYTGDGIKTPKIGLLLNPSVSLGGRLKKNNAPYNTFKPLQPGRVSLIPTLIVSNYVDNNAGKDVEVFALARAGINYYPLLDDTGSPENGLNGYEQWQVGAGGGIRFKSLLRVETVYYRAGYDMNKNTRKYFEEHINATAFFNAVQVTARFKIFKALHGTVEWRGFAKSYNNEKYLMVGLNYDFPFPTKQKNGNTTEVKSPEMAVKPGSVLVTTSQNNAQNKNISTTPLKLVNVLHFNGNKEKQLELSGLATIGEKIYMVSDNLKDIFEVQWKGQGFDIAGTITTSGVSAKSDDDFSFEGIDTYKDQFYVINEDNSLLFRFRQNGKKKSETSYSKKIGLVDNDGLEGIAIDPVGKQVYLAKERNPARIDKTYLNLKNESTFYDPKDPTEDFADLKFVSGNLYVLERRKHSILKLDSKGNEVARFSFESTTTNNIDANKQMYVVNNDEREYGLAEALLITKDRIYVGMDANDNTKWSPWFLQKFGSLGAKADGHPTVILAFEKPQGF